jgi:hypothetical protein
MGGRQRSLLRQRSKRLKFQLSRAEAAVMRSQSATSSKGIITYQLLAFNEHGVAMLSAVLRSEPANARPAVTLSGNRS